MFISDTSLQPSPAFTRPRDGECVFTGSGGGEGVGRTSAEVSGKAGVKCDHVPPQAGIVKTEQPVTVQHVKFVLK